jgi:hypothetical protein
MPKGTCIVRQVWTAASLQTGCRPRLPVVCASQVISGSNQINSDPRRLGTLLSEGQFGVLWDDVLGLLIPTSYLTDFTRRIPFSICATKPIGSASVPRAILRQGLPAADTLKERATNDSDPLCSALEPWLTVWQEREDHPRQADGNRPHRKGTRQMQWDKIEAEWFKMACRVSGTGNLSTAVAATRASAALPDAGPADEMADSAIVKSADMPDRILV